MKNVVVLYNHNMSAEYLGGQHLNDDLAPNYDSCAQFDERKSRLAEGVRDGLRSTDGIQFYHFKHLYPTAAEYQDGANHLAFWTDKLSAHLKESGESLDAIVIPFGAKESAETLAWVNDMRRQWPALKVMVTNPSLGEVHGQRPRYAVPNHADAVIANGIRTATIDRSSPDYTLAEGIDLATVNLRHGNAEANALRRLISMPELPELGAGRGV